MASGYIWPAPGVVIEGWCFIGALTDCCVADHRRSGGDAAERKGAGRGQEEAGHDQTAAVQVPALRAAGGRPGTVRVRVCQQ